MGDCFWVKLVNAECTIPESIGGGLLQTMVQKAVNDYYRETLSWTGADTWANGSYISSMYGLAGNGSGSYFTSANLSAGASTNTLVSLSGSVPPGGDLDYATGVRFLVGDTGSVLVVGYVRGIPEGYPSSNVRLYSLSGGNNPVYTNWDGVPIPAPPQNDSWYPSAKAGSNFYVISNDNIYEITAAGTNPTTLSLVAVLTSAGYSNIGGSIFCDALTFSGDGSKCLMFLTDYGQPVEYGVIVEITLGTAFNLASPTNIQELSMPSENGFVTSTISGVSYTPTEDGFVLCNRGGYLTEYGVGDTTEWDIPYFPYDVEVHNLPGDHFSFFGEFVDPTTKDFFNNAQDYDVYLNNSLLTYYTPGTPDGERYWDNDAEYNEGGNGYLGFSIGNDNVNGYSMYSYYPDWLAGGNETGYISDTSVFMEFRVYKSGVLLEHIKIESSGSGNPYDITMTCYVGGMFFLVGGSTLDNVTLVDAR